MENVVYEPQKSLGAGPPVGTGSGAVSRAECAQGGARRAWRHPSLFGRALSGRAVLAAVAASAVGAGALGAVAAPASAATPKWGYEQVSPADSTSTNVFGTGVSDDFSTVFGATLSEPLAGLPSDGRNLAYHYGLPQTGLPWTLGPVESANGNQIIAVVGGVSRDGTRALYSGALPSIDGTSGYAAYRVDPLGGAANLSRGQVPSAVSASDDLGLLAFRRNAANRPVYLGDGRQAPVQVSVDNSGALMNTATLGGSSSSGSTDVFIENALAADGSSVIFTSAHPVAGDNDGTGIDVFRRIVTPGAEQTILISDANGSGDSDASVDARYRWATRDHQKIFFVTDESLESGDTDSEQDLYMRDGTAAPIRISQGETVDGSPTGNAPIDGVGQRPEWAVSSQDGNRTFFVTSERLTQDAPEFLGPMLYERDVDEGRTRFVAGPLIPHTDAYNLLIGIDSGGILTTAQKRLGFRGIRATPDGAAFMARAALAGAPESPTLSKIYAWTRDGGLVHVDTPDPDAPPSPAGNASFMPRNLSGGIPELDAFKPARAVSDDGSRIFFTTNRSLTAEDGDDGYNDVYVWTANEGLALVSPAGREPYHAGYVDSSPDGKEVVFGTDESILPSDTDPNAVDVYRAILGGGSAPGKPVPDADPEVCAGDACQGSTSGSTAVLGIGSVGFAGAGNVLVSPDPVKPSLSVAKVKTVRGSAVTLRVRVPATGRISVSGASLRKAAKSASKAGRYSVRVSLSTRGKSLLRKKRTLKVRARVAYRVKDGKAASKTVSVTFKQPKAKRSATSKKGGR